MWHLQMFYCTSNFNRKFSYVSSALDKLQYSVANVHWQGKVSFFLFFSFCRFPANTACSSHSIACWLVDKSWIGWIEVMTAMEPVICYSQLLLDFIQNWTVNPDSIRNFMWTQMIDLQGPIFVTCYFCSHRHIDFFIHTFLMKYAT